MNVKTTRTVKLQPKHRELSRKRTKIVPELRVNGNWLAEHGFAPGCRVQITVKKNELVITPTDQPTDL